MNTNELMIGDWVYQAKFVDNDGNGHGWKEVMVGAIPFDEDKFVEPIPLTSDILKRNGFMYVEHVFMTYSEDFVWCIENDNEQYRVELEYQDSDTFDYFILTMEKGDNSMSFYLSKVHQLQHAFKLFGVDKKIEL